METLLEMSVQAGAMIVAVILVRAILYRRLPKAAFLALWVVVLARLLVPVEIPVPANCWTLAEQGVERIEALWGAQAGDSSAESESDATAESSADEPTGTSVGADGAGETGAGGAQTGTAADGDAGEAGAAGAGAGDASAAGDAGDSTPAGAIPVRTLVWAAGAVLLGVGFATAYTHHVKRFRQAIPIDMRETREWLTAHPSRQTISIKASEFIHSPITFGLVSPTILVPFEFDWTDRSRATLVLEHEYTHIVRRDTLLKVFLAAALCLHWFNPLVWLMYALVNRDIELSCDERVARRLSKSGRANYAHALLDMVERQAFALVPGFSGFGQSAIEERVVAIVKMRRLSPATILVTMAIAAAIVYAFGTTQAPVIDIPDVTSAERVEEASPDVSAPESTVRTSVYVYETPSTAAAYGAGTELVTPYYTLIATEAKFPNGFAYEYLPGEDGAASAGLPAGTSDALVVRDAASDEVRVVMFCYDIATGMPADTPGYLALDKGACTFNAAKGYAVAVPLAAADEASIAVAESSMHDFGGYEWLTNRQTGTVNLVAGLGDVPANLVGPVATASEADESGIVRVKTPRYTVGLPADVAASLTTCTYVEQRENGVGAFVAIPTAESAYGQFIVLCREPGSTAVLPDYTVEVPTGVMTADGLEVFVQARDGTGGADLASAQAWAETVAGWVAAAA